ncbi:MAG: zinc ribbon domain-containing protein [Nocardioides sp.]|nr:zinc ribbon domain-containing protein [Nocardioides sp.]
MTDPAHDAGAPDLHAPDVHAPAALTACPSCGEPLPVGAKFCEACGASLGGADSAPAEPEPGSVADEAAPIDLASGPVSRLTRAGDGAPAAAGPQPCSQCSGVVGADGYCETCGSKALSERDHFRQQPVAWLAGVCDKGVVHHRNEDAMAMSASPDPTAPDRRAVLVVLDGVSNTDDSCLGSLAGARACLPVLAAGFPQGVGTPASRMGAVAQVFARAALVANTQVVAATTPGTTRPASATFTAVVLEGRTLVHANIGDSRCYWLPDAGAGVQLTVDDSAAQAQIVAGVPRATAESSPQAHAITAWLGADSPSIEPTVGRLDITGAGWLLAVSDGLWNYASEPAQLATRIAAAGTIEPAALALALVQFANAQGGRDNITAVVARVADLGAGHNAPTAPAEPGESHG